MRAPLSKFLAGWVVAYLACAPVVGAADEVSAAEGNSADARLAQGGRLSVDKPVLDIGDVVRGQIATGVFVLHNTGEETLKILSAKPG